LKRVRGIAFTHFESEDVVRHPLVQRIVAAYESYKPKRERPRAVSEGDEGP
jgi:phosphate starvation-inducible PhoH-like protein